MTEQIAVAHCEQFIYHARGRNGYNVTASHGIRDLADDSLLQSLLTEPPNLKEYCYRQVAFHDEGIVAASFFMPDRDGWNRRTIYNHTILIREDDYRLLGADPSTFASKFVRESPESLGPIDVAQPTSFAVDLESLRRRFGDRLGDIFRTVATHNVTRRGIAEIGIRANGLERLGIVYSILLSLPPSLRVVSWTTENVGKVPWSYALAVRENWRTVVGTPENLGFEDLANLAENAGTLRTLHERYERLYSELRPYEWALYSRVLRQMLNAIQSPLGELYKIRGDRQALVRRKVLADFTAKL